MHNDHYRDQVERRHCVSFTHHSLQTSPALPVRTPAARKPAQQHKNPSHSSVLTTCWTENQHLHWTSGGFLSQPAPIWTPTQYELRSANTAVPLSHVTVTVLTPQSQLTKYIQIFPKVSQSFQQHHPTTHLCAIKNIWIYFIHTHCYTHNITNKQTNNRFYTPHCSRLRLQSLLVP